MDFPLQILRQTLFLQPMPPRPAKEIFEALKERHIYVRYFDKPRIDNYLRITIGTNEQMEMLIQALREILERQQ